MIHRILGNIYLLSIEPLDEGIDLNQQHGITHVVSAVTGALPQHLEQYKHLQVEITDEPTSNLLEHLPEILAFMDGALFANDGTGKHSGAVLVHCLHGHSRSPAIVNAYLMHKYNLTYDQAMHALKRKKPDVEPNEGFVEQLKLFKAMGCKVDPSQTEYREFLVQNSLKLDPSGSLLRDLNLFGSEKNRENSTNAFQLRCKRCRTVLATSTDVATHEAPGAESRQSLFVKRAPNSRRVISAVEASNVCSHHFMDEPTEWMKSELEKQELEGKFACPKCEAKVGGYSWRGSRCSCGKWLIPAIHLQLAKVDEMRVDAK